MFWDFSIALMLRWSKNIMSFDYLLIKIRIYCIIIELIIIQFSPEIKLAIGRKDDGKKDGL
jgi:hypothetical protein